MHDSPIDPTTLRLLVRQLDIDDLMIADADLLRFVDDLISFASNYTRTGFDSLSPRGVAQVSHHIATAPADDVLRAWDSAGLPSADRDSRLAVGFAVAHLLYPEQFEADVEPLRLNGHTLEAIWRGMNPSARAAERSDLAAFQGALLAAAADSRPSGEPASAGAVPALVRALTEDVTDALWSERPSLSAYTADAKRRYLLGLDAYWSRRIDQPASDPADEGDALVETTVESIVEVINDVFTGSLGAVVDRGLLQRLANEAGRQLLEKLAA